MILGLSGPNGAGKGEVVAFLEARSFYSCSPSDVVREELAAGGLEETRENGILVGPTPAPLRGAEPNVVTEVQAARLGGELRGVDQRGARPGEIALRPLRVRLVEEPRDGQIQHRVAQELETLVPWAAVALVGMGRVGERGLEEFLVLEDEAEALEKTGVGRTGVVAHGTGPAIHPPPRTTSPS